MENPELKKYIDEQLAAGVSSEELKKLLINHGWTSEIVDEHLPGIASSVAPMRSPALVSISSGDESSLFNEDKKKRKLGITFIVLPFALITILLTVYAISQFVISNIISSAPASTTSLNGSGMTTGLGVQDKRATIGQIINVALSLLGFLACLSIFIFVPLGIIFIASSRRELKPGVPYDERSGKGDASIIPPELGHWNWGAAFLNIWWGIYYRVWNVFFIFLPVVGAFWWIVMGVNGNKWAWQKNKWLSVEYFKKSQKKWAVWAIALFAFGLAVNILLAAVVLLSAKK